MSPETTRPSAPLTARLRAETQAVHQSLERLPYEEALAAGTLPLESYVAHLRALSVVLGVLERILGETRHPAVTAVWRDGMRKLPLLQSDLEYLGGQGIAPVPGVEDAARRMAERVRRRSVQDPASLLGYLYVLEGSTQGGRILRVQVSRAFALPGDEGTRYLSGYGRETKAMWNECKARLDGVSLDDSEKDSVVAAAAEAFAGFAEVFQRLYPIEKAGA